MISRGASTGLLLLPGALTVYLSFNAGGFFPNTPAFVALLLALVLGVRALLAEHPVRGYGPLVGIAAALVAHASGGTTESYALGNWRAPARSIFIS